MNNNPESNSPLFGTKEGASTELISLAEYNIDKRFALQIEQLHDNTIYHANAVSRRFAEIDSALTFDVLVRLPTLRSILARASFTLSTLDNDYRTLNIYYATMLSHGQWMIQKPHEPIEVHDLNRNRLFDFVNQGYLLKHSDTTLEEVKQSALSPREAILKKLKENIDRSRQYPFGIPPKD